MTKAILVRKFGGPEVMELVDLPQVAPGENDILLRQTAVGINFGDIHKRRGSAPPHALAALKLPFVPGLEAAGIVEELGSSVSGLKRGDRVAYAVPSMTGGYAETRSLPAKLAFKIPDDVADIDAASILYKGITAYGLIHRCFPVRAGQTILLHAAAGGVGSILARWAKRLGVIVIGVVSTTQKVQRALEVGCDHALVYDPAVFVDQVMTITGGGGVDVVYDGVGQLVFLPSLKCLRKYGTFVSFGQSSGAVAPLDPIDLQHKGLYLTKFSGSTYLADQSDYLDAASAVLKALADGTLVAADRRLYKLEEAVSAHQDFESRRTTGSMVLVP